MSEGEHLYDLVTESADPQACVGRMTPQELRTLASHIAHLIGINNGAETGVPGLCKTLVELEAAHRFLKDQ